MMTAILLAAVLGSTNQDRDRLLDLTRAPDLAPAIAPYNIQNCCIGGRGGPSGTPPFTIAIDGIDKAEYVMGGQMVVDLRLTNTSGRSVFIPVVFIDQFVPPFEGDEAIQFSFGIALRDASGKEHGLTGTVLRGSTKLPDTTQTLGPGESLKIHLPGHILITDGPTAPPTGEGQLVASLGIADGECRTWKLVRSSPIPGVRFIGR